MREKGREWRNIKQGLMRDMGERKNKESVSVVCEREKCTESVCMCVDVCMCVYVCVCVCMCVYVYVFVCVR
jgi:hypothetical protein